MISIPRFLVSLVESPMKRQGDLMLSLYHLSQNFDLHRQYVESIVFLFRTRSSRSNIYSLNCIFELLVDIFPEGLIG